ncbi:hypothetical protein HNR46_000437 [Haloferula luteola]|uniref:Uncharacterized protein n=1 Tax=Haloferula luteola TaxID=595692 RepID=A0A840UYY2_9BACT|nr:hypothetical protein [Haloferula luteola]MBB5350213.1 hypothetical protein [Haloferula luteola]
MPFSPFTRLLAAAIVASYGFFLFWPNPRAHHWGAQALVLLPLLLLVLMVSAQRSWPVFEPRAFYRTRPVTDGFGMRRMLGLMAAVFGGVALWVMIYVFGHNFSGRAALEGILLLVLPALAWAWLWAVVACLATRRQRPLIWLILTLLAAPILSGAGLATMRGDLNLEMKGSFFITPASLLILAAVSILPAIWWLVASRRKWRTGLGLMMWFGALIPWIMVHGQFFPKKVSNGMTTEKFVEHIESIELHPPAGEWHEVPCSELLTIKGLQKGEFGMGGFLIGESKDSRWRATWTPKIGMRKEGEGYDWLEWPVIKGTGETAEWGGTELISDEIQNRWYPNEKLEPWTRRNREGVQAMFQKPRLHPWVTGQDGENEAERSDDPSQWDWKAYGTVTRLEKAGDVDLPRGGSLRLRTGGRLLVSIAEPTSLSNRLRLKYQFEDIHPFEDASSASLDRVAGLGIYAVVEHPDTGDKWFAVFRFVGRSPKTEGCPLFLGGVQEFEMICEGTPAEQAAQELRLRKGRLAVFVAVNQGSFPPTVVRR